MSLPPASPAASDQPTPPAAGRRVLLADDEPGIRNLITRYLERAGFLVTAVVHGGEALAHLAAHPVDLLITDLVMPETEGIEMIMHLRRTHPQLPIIAISGGDPSSPGDFLHIAGKLGAQRTLRKPFDCETLLKVVRELLPARPA